MAGIAVLVGTKSYADYEFVHGITVVSPFLIVFVFYVMDFWDNPFGLLEFIFSFYVFTDFLHSPSVFL